MSSFNIFNLEKTGHKCVINRMKDKITKIANTTFENCVRGQIFRNDSCMHEKIISRLIWGMSAVIQSRIFYVSICLLEM